MQETIVTPIPHITFKELPKLWKSLIILGGIFSILCIVLSIVMIIMFKTDLIPWYTMKEASKDDLLEFDDIFEQLATKTKESREKEETASEISSNSSEVQD